MPTVPESQDPETYRNTPRHVLYNRSVVRVEGEPKQPLTNASATVSAVMFVIGMASGQRVKLSTQVRRYVKPPEGGSGPTISMCTMSKRASGVANSSPHFGANLLLFWDPNASEPYHITQSRTV